VFDPFRVAFYTESNSGGVAKRSPPATDLHAFSVPVEFGGRSSLKVVRWELLCGLEQ